MLRLAIIYALLTIFLPIYGNFYTTNEVRFISPISQARIQAVDKPEVDNGVEESLVIETYLKEKKSPLADYAYVLVGTAGRYKLDVRVLVAISGIESNFCKSFPKKSHNCWGIGSSRLMYFRNFDESIDFLGRLIGEAPVYKRYRQTYKLQDLGRVYCGKHCGIGTKGWADSVAFFLEEMEKIENEKEN